MAYSIYRVTGPKDEVVRFGFVDARNNYIDVPLTQKQVDEYRDGLNMFATKKLKEKKGKKLW